MKLALIAAHSENLVIGKDNSIPWHYSEDLKRFKRLTIGHTIVMGRKTYESIGSKPLPGRENIVISRTRNYDNVTCFTSLETAYKYLKNKDIVYIIGGAQLYRESLPNADMLVITVVHKKVDGDVYFPEYRDQISTVWEEISREEKPDYTFIDYKRK
ncbi:MAG TPA: dihydrofolate reductase [Balneolales bacterium]|nr:dihydrofolate reductase [Balneolales bacterium]